MTAIRHIIGERNKRPIDLDGSVALIGNSDKMLGSGLGAEIDAFDTVFRFNLCDLAKRFRPDIGKKTDYCFFSLNISTHKYPHSPQEHQRFIALCRHCNIICYPKHTANVRKFNRKPFLMNMPFAEINQVFIRLLGTNAPLFDLKHHPRNGIKLLACLLQEGIKPTLYGFDLEDHGDNKHYFDDEVQLEKPDGGHMPSWEYQLLKQLEKSELITVIH